MRYFMKLSPSFEGLFCGGSGRGPAAVWWFFGPREGWVWLDADVAHDGVDDGFGGLVDLIDIGGGAYFTDLGEEGAAAFLGVDQVEDFVGDELGVLALVAGGEEVVHCGDYLFHVFSVFEGDGRVVGPELFGHYIGRIECGGLDADDVDAEVAELVVVADGEGVDGGFGGVVDGECGDLVAGQDAGQVYDEAVFLGAHRGKDGADEAVGADGVDLEELVGLVGGEGLADAVEGGAGVVDEDIETAFGVGEDGFDGGVDGRLVGDVEFDGFDFGVVGGGPLADLCCVLGVGGVEVTHGGVDGVALGGEGFEGEEAESCGAACEEDVFHFLFVLVYNYLHASR